MELLFAAIALATLALIWLFPLLAIASSERTSGSEKLAWVLAGLFISWFAWLAYLILAPLNTPTRSSPTL